MRRAQAPNTRRRFLPSDVAMLEGRALLSVTATDPGEQPEAQPADIAPPTDLGNTGAEPGDARIPSLSDPSGQVGPDVVASPSPGDPSPIAPTGATSSEPSGTVTAPTSSDAASNSGNTAPDSPSTAGSAPENGPVGSTDTIGTTDAADPNLSLAANAPDRDDPEAPPMGELDTLFAVLRKVNEFVRASEAQVEIIQKSIDGYNQTIAAIQAAIAQLVAHNALLAKEAAVMVADRVDGEFGNAVLEFITDASQIQLDALNARLAEYQAALDHAKNQLESANDNLQRARDGLDRTVEAIFEYYRTHLFVQYP